MKNLMLIPIFFLVASCAHQENNFEGSPGNQPEPTTSAPPVTAKKDEAKARCFKTDTVKAWEAKYVLAKSGADDVGAEAFKQEFARFKNDKKVPKEKCARIIWLKEKTCSDDFGSGRTRNECLSDPHYLKKIEDDSYVGP